MSTISTTVTGSIAAPRHSFYAWLVPGVFFNQLETVLRDTAGLPGVARTTDTSGPWDRPGSHRTVHMTDGNTVREEVTAADAPDYFAYVVSRFTHPMVRLLVKEARGQWWFTDEGAGTHVKWTYAFECTSPLAVPLLFPVVKLMWNRSMRSAVEAIRVRAQEEVRGGIR